jgi:LL-diaminopimelate aminotransferase
VLPRPTALLTELPPYVFAELDRLKARARARGQALLDLGIGSPDQPVPAPVAEALAQAAADPALRGYPPFRGLPRFFDAVATFMRVRFGVTLGDPSREIVALSGAKEGIAQLIAAYCGPGDVALVPAVYYPVYARAALLNGAGVEFVATTAATGFLPDLDTIPRETLQRAKLLIVNYPNNPTGAVADLAFYERAVAFARRHDLLLVSDLAYSELTYGGYVAPSALQVPGARDCVVEFHSCSKSFHMAGMRIGFAVGNAEALDALAAFRTNVGYGTPTAVQHAAAYALEHAAELTRPVVASYGARRAAVVDALAGAGWPADVPPATMYAWLPVPGGFGEWEWVTSLIDREGLVVTPGSAFGPGGAGYFRLSFVAPPEALADAVTRLAGVAAAV